MVKILPNPSHSLNPKGKKNLFRNGSNKCRLLSSFLLAQFPRACTVQTVSGRGWAEPLALTARIARHVERARKLPGRFQELVADFIHGEDGQWWFLQVSDRGKRK